MLGPFCETEVYAPVVTALGLKSLKLWRETFPGTVVNGTLVVAPGATSARWSTSRGRRRAISG